MSNKPPPRPKTIRCAIYTRKSTEEGLDQQFNSLDASAKQPKRTFEAKSAKAGRSFTIVTTTEASPVAISNGQRSSD